MGFGTTVELEDLDNNTDEDGNGEDSGELRLVVACENVCGGEGGDRDNSMGESGWDSEDWGSTSISTSSLLILPTVSSLLSFPCAFLSKDFLIPSVTLAKETPLFVRLCFICGCFPPSLFPPNDIRLTEPINPLLPSLLSLLLSLLSRVSCTSDLSRSRSRLLL